MKIKLDSHNLHALGTSGVGFTKQQLALLGLPSLPKKGWLSDLIGSEIDQEVYEKCLALKGSKSKNLIANIPEGRSKGAYKRARKAILALAKDKRRDALARLATMLIEALE